MSELEAYFKFVMREVVKEYLDDGLRMRIFRALQQIEAQVFRLEGHRIFGVPAFIEETFVAGKGIAWKNEVMRGGLWLEVLETSHVAVEVTTGLFNFPTQPET